MSPAPSRRRPEVKGKMKVGICQNQNYLNPNTDAVGPCPKCASGEKIKVEVKRISDFRCPVCGEKLTPVKTPIPLWVWGAAAAAILAIVFLIVFMGKGGDKGSNGEATTTDTTEIVVGPPTDSDSVVVETHETTGPEVKEDTNTKPEEPQKGPHTSPKSNKVLGGAATMTTSGGYTTIKFNRSYNLDQGDADHSTLRIESGDEIYMANVRNGYLFGGQLKRRNGEETPISGIKVRL